MTSFLPEPYQHPYEINPEFGTSVAYLSMEFAIDQSFKIYSGGLGFLAGSHMRSASDLRQNMVGIGMLWTYGYYDQVPGEFGEMAVQYRRKKYAFLQDLGLQFVVMVHNHPVQVKAYFLPGDVFGTVPMFFLSTDLEENDPLSRAITHRLYDQDGMRRIAQYVVLGQGAARLLEVLGVEPDIIHLNEAHGLAAAFRMLERLGSVEKVRERLVLTTHTPEAAGNEVTNIELLQSFSYFGGLSLARVREVTGIQDGDFNHTLAALRMSRVANAVSKLHGEVSRQMWAGFESVCPIIHITNAQNKKYWADSGLEHARKRGDIEELKARKGELKEQLFREVANQTGKLFDPKVITIVWARRFAAYKRADLLVRDLKRFRALLANAERPVQIIWAGKPYPTDYGAIELFNHLVQVTHDEPRAAVLNRYELALSKMLKDGADIWLNTPVVTREASGTSGMTAAMNGAVNLSTDDGWVCEFAVDGHNSFIVPKADPTLSPEARDVADANGFYELLHSKVLPLYYNQPNAWWQMVLNSMNDVVPFFDSDRMAAQYYTDVYAYQPDAG